MGQHLIAFALLQFPIKGQCAEALLLQIHHQILALLFGVAESQRTDRAKVVQQPGHRLKTIGAGDLIKALLNQAFGGDGLHFDLFGLAHELPGQFFDALGVGG